MSAVNSNRWDYETIKAAAKSLGVRVTDLLALAPQNDPFYSGTPADLEQATWFAEIWNRAGYQSGVHLRRVHYWTVSQGNVLMPNGLPYENTDKCWKFLTQAGKQARYLELVRIADIADNKSPDPHINARYLDDAPGFRIDAPELNDPDVWLYGIEYENAQPYHLEVWCEKSTMNDVLEPLCRRYNANLVTFEGEVSITACYALIERIRAAGGKPTRVWYISDFDPAGNSMPVAMSRKVEYMLGKYALDFDVRVNAFLLTLPQVQTYQLPRTPIKDSEKRAANFEDAFGIGAVELDALEALHPGELGQLLDGELSRYYSQTAAREVSAQRQALRNAIGQQIDGITAHYQSEIEALRGMIDELKEIAIDAAPYFVPRFPPHVQEPDGWLFDSTRDYHSQIERYKIHKGQA